ncbi:hypothetical protein PG997_001017 [Apiospora hydei]|uniref:Uncharacterized protein n=1 Tax=Apiospora hydei TaxID=1337664 RepID=A0ABR1XCD0_9PEZI
MLSYYIRYPSAMVSSKTGPFIPNTCALHIAVAVSHKLVSRTPTLQSGMQQPQGSSAYLQRWRL